MKTGTILVMAGMLAACAPYAKGRVIAREVRETPLETFAVVGVVVASTTTVVWATAPASLRVGDPVVVSGRRGVYRAGYLREPVRRIE